MLLELFVDDVKCTVSVYVIQQQTQPLTICNGNNMSVYVNSTIYNNKLNPLTICSATTTCYWSSLSMT